AKGTLASASIAMAASASILVARSAFRKVTAFLFRPRRAIGAAPTTCAIVIASTIAAPLLGSPVTGIASRAKTIGPAACGTLKAPFDSSQRTSAPRATLRAEFGAFSETVVVMSDCTIIETSWTDRNRIADSNDRRRCGGYLQDEPGTDQSASAQPNRS